MRRKMNGRATSTSARPRKAAKNEIPEQRRQLGTTGAWERGSGKNMKRKTSLRAERTEN